MYIHMAAKEISVCEVAIWTAASLLLHLNQIILKAFPQFPFVKPILLVQITAWDDRTIFFEKKGALGN